MPTTRRRTTRRPRRQVRRGKKPTVSNAVKTYVKRIMPKPEVKVVWNHDNEVQLSTLSQGQYLSGPSITQGTGPSNRVGNDINSLGMHIKGVLYNNSTQESYVRAIVLGCTGTQDPTASLFRYAAAGTTAGLSAVVGLDAMYQPLNKLDFKVYWDQVFKLGGSGSGAAGSNTRMFTKFIKFNKRKVQYQSTSTGAGSQNWLYKIIYIASDANDDTSTGTAVELSALTRYYFTDA